MSFQHLWAYDWCLLKLGPNVCKSIELKRGYPSPFHVLLCLPISVDGGELFDRITDENYNLTELDAILFTKQICEGIYYLHQQYILHLDLKVMEISTPCQFIAKIIAAYAIAAKKIWARILNQTPVRTNPKKFQGWF